MLQFQIKFGELDPNPITAVVVWRDAYNQFEIGVLDDDKAGRLFILLSAVREYHRRLNANQDWRSFNIPINGVTVEVTVRGMDVTYLFVAGSRYHK